MTPGSLSALLAPDDRDQLLAAGQARRHLHLPQATVPPLSWEEVDFLVATTDLSRLDPLRPPLRVVRGAAELPLAELVGDDGCADRARVQDAWHRGYTLVINQVQTRLPTVDALARGLSWALGGPTTVNLYVTPPGTQGFDPHHDTRDAIFLQALGEKRWLIYAPGPGAAEASAQGSAWGAPIDTCTLAAGGLLFVPRGTGHAGRAGPAPSAHWSISQPAPRWDAPRLDPPPPVEAPWLAAPPLDLDTPIRRPDRQAWRVVRQGDHLILDRLAVSMRCPAQVEPALRALLAGEPLTPRALPGALDDDVRLTLVRHLVMEGFLVRVPTHPT